MTKEYLGVNAVNDLFDIIDENYVSKADFENKEKVIASAICVGSALIAECLLKLAEAIMAAKGVEGGETMNETLIATAADVNKVLDKYFKDNSNTSVSDENSIVDDEGSVVDENSVATEDDTNAVLGKYFN